MTCGIAGYIVSRMVELDIIDSCDKDYYMYKLIVVFETAVTMFSLLVISMIMRRLYIMLIFLIAYMCIRRFSGDLHLDSFHKCYFTSLIVFSGVIYIIPKLSLNKYFTLLTFLSALVIVLFGTVNHPHLNFNPEEFKLMKNRTRKCVLIECMILATLRTFGVRDTYVIGFSMAIIMCALLIVAAKFIKQEVN